MQDSERGSGSPVAISETMSEVGIALQQRMEEVAGRATHRDDSSESKRPRLTDAGELSELYRGGVPELYAEASWDRVRTPAVREWARTLGVRTWKRSDGVASNWRLRGCGLLLLGPVGTGKSSAAALVAREAVKLGRTVRWTYVPDLCDRMTSSPKDRVTETRLQESADVLIWDDFGVRDLAAWEIGFLDQIVESRYRRMRLMVVTSNMEQQVLRSDTRLNRMMDRWRERTAVHLIELAGASMRSTG